MDDLDFNLDTPVLTLQETTTTVIAGERVGCGNVLERVFSLPDGSTEQGLSVRLAFAKDDHSIIVGMGSEFAVNETRWRVLAVLPRSEEQRLGSAVIEQIG